jgi:hypothetical protein
MMHRSGCTFPIDVDSSANTTNRHSPTARPFRYVDRHTFANAFGADAL